MTGSDNKTPITVYGIAVWVVKVPSRTAAYILPVAVHLCRCKTLIINLVSRMPGTYNTVHDSLSKRSELCSHERLQDLPEGLANSTCIIRLLPHHSLSLLEWRQSFTRQMFLLWQPPSLRLMPQETLRSWYLSYCFAWLTVFLYIPTEVFLSVSNREVKREK